jgi:hypothetical protein
MQHALTDLERRMLDDLTWALGDPQVRQHQGQFVAVRNRKVLAVGTDRNAVVESAAAQEGCPKEEVVVVVVPGDELEEVPH